MTAASSHPFAPSDIERYSISLRSLLAAVTGLERDREADRSIDELQLGRPGD